MVVFTSLALFRVEGASTDDDDEAEEGGEEDDETIRFEFLAQGLRRLQELVAVIEPGWLDEATDAENNGGLPEVFDIDEEATCAAVP